MKRTKYANRAANQVMIVLLLQLLLLGCGNDLEKEVISNWPNGEIQKVYYFSSNGDLREKVVEEKYYENGQQEMRGEFKNGVRHGKWIYWFEDGRKWTESAYENDMRVGQSVVWRNSGLKNYEGMYSKGKPHGTWVFYDLDGSRMKEVMFEYGVKTKELDYKEGVPFNLPDMDSLVFEVR